MRTKSIYTPKIKRLPIRVLLVFTLFMISVQAFPQTNDLNQKLMMGYQGWFFCEGDDSDPNDWRHWFTSNTDPSASNLGIDMWPDMSEYKQAYATNMTYQSGDSARLFSSYDSSTTNLHFKWMRNYNIYGIYLQRFLGEVVNDPRFFNARNHVTQNVMSAANTYNRHFAIMYDLSGVPDDGNMFDKLTSDWEYMVDSMNVTGHSNYVYQEGKPVIGIWGIGFSGRGLNPSTFVNIIDYFQNSAPAKYQAYVMGGVPSRWRTLDGDSETDSQWGDIYRSLDMLSPWTVGRYSDQAGADNWKNNRIMPDMDTCNNHNVDYMPVVWPGFSWHNLTGGTLNQIPRDSGRFYWRQAYNALDAGAEFLYVAMFDEVDEGTAMFKLAETQQDVPAQGDFVTLDADGYDLPSDWYLCMAGETQKMLDGSIPLSDTITVDKKVTAVKEPVRGDVQNALSVYPNPLQNKGLIIRYKGNMASAATLSIHDLSGKPVYRQTFKAHKVTLPGNYLSAGVYILRLQSDQKLFTRKLIVK